MTLIQHVMTRRGAACNHVCTGISHAFHFSHSRTIGREHWFLRTPSSYLHGVTVAGTLPRLAPDARHAMIAGHLIRTVTRFRVFCMPAASHNVFDTFPSAIDS
jgi:hypothetical protein